MNKKYTISQAAQKIGVTQRTLRQWVARGKVRCVKVFGNTSPRYVSLSDVWNFINAEYQAVQTLRKWGIEIVMPDWAREALDEQD